MTKTLNFQALKKRITKITSTKDALSDVTPFSFGEQTFPFISLSNEL